MEEKLGSSKTPNAMLSASVERGFPVKRFSLLIQTSIPRTGPGPYKTKNPTGLGFGLGPIRLQPPTTRLCQATCLVLYPFSWSAIWMTVNGNMALLSLCRPQTSFSCCLSTPTSPSLSLYPVPLSKTSFSSSKPKPHGLLTSHPPHSNQPAPLPHFHAVSNGAVNNCHHLLDLSVRYGDVELIEAVHASILKLGEDTYLANALIVAYLKLGLVPIARKVFAGLSCPNVVSYAAMISGLAKSNREREAVEIFFRMRSSDIELNEFSLVAILTVCIRLLDLELGFQLHAIVIKIGFINDTFVSNALMGLYGKCGFFETVLEVFDEMPHRDIASWNTVISSAVKEMMYERAFKLFCDMWRIDGFKVDQFTISTILVAATEMLTSIIGREIHAYAIKIGLESNISVTNALIRFYRKCGTIQHVVALFQKMFVRDVITWTEMITAYMEFGLPDLALSVFYKMPERNSVSYNTILTGFCQNGEGLKALEFFRRMVEGGVEITDFTLTGVLNACGLLMEEKLSKQIHGFILKIGFGSNACIEAALLDMCTRCGRMADAQKMFSQRSFSLSSSIIWTSMISGYARNAQPVDAISLFFQGQLEGAMVVDKVASTAVLSVCGTLGFHEMGKQIHNHALKSGFLSDLGVGNALITMYSKCNNMDDAIEVFNGMPAHDVVSLNCLIAGHLLHRQGDEALSVWSKMEKAGTSPDAVTIALVISAYRHTNSNSVDECQRLFHSMKAIYHINPTVEHFASLVGVLGHWGLLHEAEELIKKMPIEPEASVWRALLDACRIHSNATTGKQAAKHLLAMEPQDSSTYILVSNLYSASGRWHCSDVVREEMRLKGFKKHPARSWIIHDNKVHSFYARDKSHPQAKDIYSGLEILIKACLKAGYAPDTSFVLHEVEEHHKNDFLFHHSAKLAVTYALLMSRPGRPIRIMKNILLCGDCHTFLKYVSIVTRREIILRDTSGHHCFSDAQCSCRDYWS